MSENTPSETTTNDDELEPTDPAAVTTPDPDESQDHTDERKLRKRAQAAEANLATATSQVEALQSREVERLTADRLATPSDLFTYGEGLTLAELADDTGAVAPALVTEAVEALLAKRPGLAAAALRQPVRGTYANSGQFQKPRQATPAKASWSNVKMR